MSLTPSGLWQGLFSRLVLSLFELSLLLIKYEVLSLDLLLFLQQYPYDIPTEAFSFEIFKQAFVAVQSCVVHLQVCPSKPRIKFQLGTVKELQ